MPEFKQYDGITRDELANLQKNLAREGVTVPDGDDVAIKGPFGVELRATYDEAKKILKIQITKKPFYIPESEIWKIVDAGTVPYAGN